MAQTDTLKRGQLPQAGCEQDRRVPYVPPTLANWPQPYRGVAGLKIHIFVTGYLDVGKKEGATVALDGRKAANGEGFLVGPSVLDRVKPGMRVAKEEIFGPVLSVVRAESLDEALALGRDCPYGNGASIFTQSGYAARQFKQHFNAGMIGINVGVPAPMAWFPFTGWNQSFFGDLHIQGVEGVQFYTRQKMTMTRWFATVRESAHDPIWKK